MKVEEEKKLEVATNNPMLLILQKDHPGIDISKWNLPDGQTFSWQVLANTPMGRREDGTIGFATAGDAGDLLKRIIINSQTRTGGAQKIGAALEQQGVNKEDHMLAHDQQKVQQAVVQQQQEVAALAQKAEIAQHEVNGVYYNDIKDAEAEKAKIRKVEDARDLSILAAPVEVAAAGVAVESAPDLLNMLSEIFMPSIDGLEGKKLHVSNNHGGVFSKFMGFMGLKTGDDLMAGPNGTERYIPGQMPTLDASAQVPGLSGPSPIIKA